ncbi:potassium uptake protein, TrkH family [Peptoniphilus duerdenii ATCC BAA-1640]|uniref:Potassium uptake protein, TrkH family n=1 Tax=Peptoniphilus duerdenii ATCC BAA-1640 TaxID=862517 RepID=E0NLG3_9FIRM|nr:TrkH family potassium uptake protein [Peptoniphilus duerdenii]EFM25353.1 potassium uptake protein, TrkH family [Peptoniphilus duerdenii ATCC BAA-1640]
MWELIFFKNIMTKIYERIVKNVPLFLGMSFLIVILIGATLLSLPIASVDGNSVGFVNSFFTASSATAVTGLVVANTATQWTMFGKVVIITLIQIGGLGTITLFSIATVLLGKKVSLQQRLLVKEQLNITSMSGIVKWVIYVTKITFLIEFTGALLLSFSLIPKYGFITGVWYSIFHAISAFCNAGFDLFGDSIVSYSGDIYINMIICGLVIMGGLGFLVYMDIYNSRNFRNLKMHSKVVISVSALLLIIGTVATLLIEYNNSLSIGDFGFGHKVLASFFQSTVTRTAGFNSIDIGQVHDATAIIYILLMFIGGSPASTAGGLKTTTFAVMIFSTIGMVRGEHDIVIFNRKIDKEVILRALAITIVCISLVITVTMAVAIIEHDRFEFLDILFESVSAFGTVGMTRGITPHLSDISKIILGFTMFIGRVGPTTIAVGLMKTKPSSIKYASGKILVG